MDLLSADALNLRVLAVGAMLLESRQKLLLLRVWLANSSESTILIVEHFELSELELGHETVIDRHAIKCVQQVMDARQPEQNLLGRGRLHLLE